MSKYILSLLFFPCFLSASDNLFSDTYYLWKEAKIEQMMHTPKERAYWYYQGQIDAYDVILRKLSPPSDVTDAQ